MEVDPLPNTLSRTNITKLKQHFARHGIPLIIMTDNGPQFTAAEFKHSASSGIFINSTSSLHYPRSNGKVENAVKMIKDDDQSSSHRW